MRRALLLSGVLSSLWYVGMNVYVPLQWQGYNSASQVVSELSAIGAPTRPLWMALALVYVVLVTAFGFGVLQSANGRRALRGVGGLLIVYGLSGVLWLFAPMHMRGAEFGLTDAAHIALGALTVLLMFVAIVLAAATFGSMFRQYSVATIVVLLVFGLFTGLDSPNIAANLPTPWIGVWERVSIAAFLLWIAVLAVVLLDSSNRSTRS